MLANLWRLLDRRTEKDELHTTHIALSAPPALTPSTTRSPCWINMRRKKNSSYFSQLRSLSHIFIGTILCASISHLKRLRSAVNMSKKHLFSSFRLSGNEIEFMAGEECIACIQYPHSTPKYCCWGWCSLQNRLSVAKEPYRMNLVSLFSQIYSHRYSQKLKARRARAKSFRIARPSDAENE